ncbi:AMP-binding protein [Ilumatobacter nonamiensis]|uniref:AMP-binding protein n=1 Tax=Ilumatobacter nonamiensis TaxID=467093 RepID=UPI000345DE2C|nr:AMP-binding protein [Ilumatobacter nonamiensis]
MDNAVPGFWYEATETPEWVAVHDIDGTAYTAGEILAKTNRVSNALRAEGVEAGDDVAILTRNRADTLVLERACAQIGVYHTMVNSHLTAPEVAYILEDSSPRRVFVEDRTAELARRAVDLAGIEHGRVCSLDPGDHFVTVEEWSSTESVEAPSDRTIGPVMLYTSGTSGRPKGVRPPRVDMSPEEYATIRSGLLRRYGIDPSEQLGNGVHLVTSPLYHAAPLANASIALDLRHPVVLMDRFDAASALLLIEEHAVTWTHVVPTMMRRFMELPEAVRAGADTSSLRWLIHAAAPCPVDLKRRVIDWLGDVVWEYYASTEGGGTVISAHEWLERPGSVGRPYPGAEIRIFDEVGNDVPPGVTGDIYMLNNRPFTYHNDPEKTAASMRGNYVTAGDVGYLDEAGYLFIADRRTDLILTGGVNVYPREVEDVLIMHSDVADVAVIGRPDDDLGQVVHAVVELADPDRDSEDLVAELSLLVAEQLSSQKHPRSYEFRDQLPRNEAGKLLRRVLRDEAAGPAASSASSA